MTKDSKPRVVLTLVVKNEEKILRRCLDAAGPYIDGLVVCCNGTDATKEIAKAWALEHELPQFILTDPWKNFAHNRTRSAQFTKKFVKEKFWPLKQTYMLLLDADMVFRMPTGVWPPMTDFGYRLLQRGTDGLLWPNTRLCRLDLQWDSVSVTHEYWRPTPNPGRDPFTLDSHTVWIDDIGDGGSKGDKFERDIALLTQGLIDEPNNERYWFYLAESLFNSGRHAESIPKYEKRRTLGGYHEEVWYSLYKIGQAHLSTGALDLGTHALLQAFQEKPGRVEPLVKLAQHFRERGQNHLALMMARYVRDTPVPDGLFVESQMYSQPLEEIAICAFYTGNHDEGRLAGEELLARRGIPHPRTENAAKCVSFYVKPLAPHAVRQGQFSVHEEIRKFPGKFFGLEEPNQTEYLPSNPTIVEHNGKTLVNVRLVNYYHERGRVFAPKDPDGVVRTRNVLLEGWSPETGEHEVEMEVHADIPAAWDHTTRVRGLEDQRWCSFGGQVWLTATCFNVPGAGGMPRVVLGRLNSETDDILSVVDVVELKYAGSRHYEKNWLPWNRGDGKFRVIYGYEPFMVLLVDTETGECTVESQTVPEWNCSRWRGSCAPVRIGCSDRWLAMIHETAWFEGQNTSDQRTVYMHRFIEIEGDRIIRRSPLFTFDHAGVEYAAGMLWHHLPCTTTTLGGPQVIVTHSVEESSARWKVFDWYLVSDMLDGGLP